jgi:hypothetical protein
MSLTHEFNQRLQLTQFVVGGMTPPSSAPPGWETRLMSSDFQYYADGMLRSASVGSFTVTTDQQSYSSADLKRKFGLIGQERFAGGLVLGYTDPANPTQNAIANDAGISLKGREFLGLWVYELGNALAEITNIVPRSLLTQKLAME